jgi:hypothetical protein
MIDVDGGYGICPGFRLNVGVIAIAGIKMARQRRP